jgi:hypothetical protein
MLSTGFILALSVSLILLLYLALGVKFSGWPAILLGVIGIVYCFLATPSLSLLPVYAISWVFVLYGTLAIAASYCRHILRIKNDGR